MKGEGSSFLRVTYINQSATIGARGDRMTRGRSRKRAA
jgi:hypothetical protein